MVAVRNICAHEERLYNYSSESETNLGTLLKKMGLYLAESDHARLISGVTGLSDTYFRPKPTDRTGVGTSGATEHERVAMLETATAVTSLRRAPYRTRRTPREARWGRNRTTRRSPGPEDA